MRPASELWLGIAALLSILAAITLAWRGADGWGWFLIVGVILGILSA